MNEMVERVARAIVRVFEHSWEGLTPVQQEMAYTRARAAIAAMRRPTGDMLGHLEDVLDYTPDLGEAEDYWQHMIDAALTDG